MNKKAIDQIEELDTIGQDSEVKAIKAIREIEKEDEKKSKEQDALSWEKLHSSRKTITGYNDALLSHMKLLKDQFSEEVPKGYQWWIVPTEKGIMLGVRTREGKWFAKGTKVSGEPKYDINAVERLLFKGLEFIDSLEQKEEKKEGLIL